ncbi:uncharacterized protein LOC128238015 [Mya arenaria]|uniref:uncharacterized protein LOC128238015 n=1 Tax=Mya arenaria TaxID=6604 RepID=UPI0022E748AE|nr:uncharacterized protein LOC128238015 [Mya arenaria]
MQANQNRMYAENDSLMLRVKMTEQTAARARASLPKESRVAAKKQVLQETVTPANNARFDKTAETETLAEIAENMTVAVVEYTNQSVYIGEMEGNMMTFARRPVGKLTSSLNVKNKQSVILNPLDKMKINRRYIIAKFEGCKKDNVIQLSEIQIQLINQSVASYCSKQASDI